MATRSTIVTSRKKDNQSPFPARVMLLNTRPLYPFSAPFFPLVPGPVFFSPILLPRDRRVRAPAPRVGTSGDEDCIVPAVDRVGGRFLTVSFWASEESFISSLLRFFLPAFAFRFSTLSSALSGAITLAGKTSFSCSCAVDSVLVRLPTDLLLLVLTFSADPVLRRINTGRAGTVFVLAVTLPRPAGTEDVPLRNLSTGSVLSTGWDILVLTGLRHSGPRRPPTVVSVGAMLPRILVRMLISDLIFVAEDVRTGKGLRGTETSTTGDALALVDAALAVLLALLGPLVDGLAEPDGPPSLAFFDSKMNGVIPFSIDGGLIFS